MPIDLLKHGENNRMKRKIYKKRCRKRIWSFTSDYGNGAKHIET